MKVLVVDASAFIMGFNPSAVDAETYSVDAIGRELISGSTAELRFQTAQLCGKLTVRNPSEESLSKVSEVSLKLGDRHVLSVSDMNILALALDLKLEGKEPVIVSDDYAIQNVSEALNMPYVSLAAFGILHKFQWISYCPACYRRYPQNPPSEKCDVCGSKLKRRVLSRRVARGRSRTAFVSKGVESGLTAASS